MSTTLVFITDVCVTVFVCIGLVFYIRANLRSLLIELCGTAERANFWLVFSNVSLVLVPLIFALDYRPEFGRDNPIAFEIAGQLKYSLIGFIVTLCSLALILLRFIPRGSADIAVRPVR
jgi:uncharacterized membrane protein YhaH (DUF805 family)